MSTKDRRRRRRTDRWTTPEIHAHPEAYLRSFWPSFVRVVHAADHYGLLLADGHVYPLGTAADIAGKGWLDPANHDWAEGVYVLHAIRQLENHPQRTEKHA